VKITWSFFDFSGIHLIWQLEAHGCSEEVFDFSHGEMTSQKIKELKTSFNNEFSLIYQLCEFVLENATKVSLVEATLETYELVVIMCWIFHQSQTTALLELDSSWIYLRNKDVGLVIV